MNSHIQLNEAGEFLRYIPAVTPIEWDDNNYCTVLALIADGKAEQFRVHPFYASVEPSHDPITQAVSEIDPVLVDDVWTQQWQVTELSPEQIEENQASKAAADVRLVAEKIEALWRAADKYTSSYISGVAIGILTIGAMRQLPKAMAVTAWSGAIWAEYYARKEMVTATSEDNHDFSWFGPIPHSVPELRAEAVM